MALAAAAAAIEAQGLVGLMLNVTRTSLAKILTLPARPSASNNFAAQRR